MNSNENTPQDIVRKLNDYLEENEQARWLADVFCIWDQKAHEWLPFTPILIRTEMQDILLAWPDEAHLHISTTPIDTYDAIKEERLLAVLAGGRQKMADLCWRHRSCLNHFVGSPIQRFVLVPASVGDELFIYFGNGESMRIASTRVVSHMQLGAA